MTSSKHSHKDRILAYCVLGLGIAQVVVIILSWIVSAVMYDSTVHSLLSTEGIRWFFGHFTDNLLNPLLVWMLLLAISIGCFVHSGLSQALLQACRHTPLSFRERLGLRFVLAESCLFILTVILLAFIPHAILLSATGDLFPSSFSNGLIPIIAFFLGFISISYGVTSGSLRTINNVSDSLTTGIISIRFWLLCYILLIELLCSIRFAFL